MSQRFIQTMNGIQGVANSATATLNLKPNLRYHALHLFMTIAGVAADVLTIASNVKLKVGGVTIRDWSPTQIRKLQIAHGITPAVGQLSMFFSEPQFKDPRVGEMYSWDLFDQGLFTLEITFLNPGGGAVGVTSVVAEVDTLRNTMIDPSTKQRVPFLRIIKAMNQSAVFSGSGIVGITTIDRSLPIRRLLIDASANDFSTVEVIADSVSLWNQLPIDTIDAVQAAYGITSSQFNCGLFFDYDDMGRSKLEAANLEVRLNATGALTATILNMQEANSFR